MRLFLFFSLAVSFFFFIFLTHVVPARGDELDDITKKLEELQKARDMSVAATTPLESRANVLEKQLADIKNRVTSIENDLAKKKKDLETAEGHFVEKQKELALRIRKGYIRSYMDSPILTLFSQAQASELTRDLAYQQAQTDQDKEQITILALWIKDLEGKRAKLEDENNRLAAVKVKVDEESSFLKKEIAGAKAYQANLSGEIATLTARQQSILSARSGTFITSVGEVPIGSDFNASIAFKSQAPGNSFAAFAFGAYTHRNGMSQYGAKEMAGAKNYKDIIQWYYGHGVRKDEGMAATIDVSGFGQMDFQTYLYGIAEMPSDWPMEALKAQAVAARSFANRSGKPICTTEACQVFSKSKSDNPPEAWKKAVDETNKEIIDGDVSAQYSSTAGGYLNTSGWDTTDRSNSGDWTSRAWESKAGSPWFYKAWYRSGYLNSGANCGRSHPWLSQEEFSDIVNAAIVLGDVSSDDRILPTTIGQCAVGGSGGNPYSISELREKANVNGGAVTNVSSVSVTHNSSGQTASVKFQTNRGEISLSGADFKRAFNLRAPGYISIPQNGFAFFNIEKT